MPEHNLCFISTEYRSFQEKKTHSIKNSNLNTILQQWHH